MTKLVLFSASLFVCLSSCLYQQSDPAPNVEHVQIKTKVIRIDEMINPISDYSALKDSLHKIKSLYPIFYKIYSDNILGLNDTIDLKDQFQRIFSIPATVKLYELVEDQYADFRDVENGLESFMRYLKYYVPQTKPVTFYTIVSLLSLQNFLFDDQSSDGIGIGLDMFLGDQYPYYTYAKRNPSFSKYLSRTFNKDHLVRKTAFAIVSDLVGDPSGNQLLDIMINHGITLYILDKVLPHYQDTIVLEYTGEQLEWLYDNELRVWAFLFDEKLFYESNSLKIDKYINPSPHSPGMPRDAPGRVADFIGWNIVKSYMQQNPKTSISELVNMKNSQLLLDKSRYKPKRK